MNQVMAYCLKEKCADRPVMTQRSDIEAYLRFHFGLRQNEYVAVLFLDTGISCYCNRISLRKAR